MRYLVLPVLLILIQLSACTPRVALQEPSLSIRQSTDGPVSIENISTCVKGAAERLDWSVKDEPEKGHLIAEFQVRSHYAMADIRFNEDRLSIHYRDSAKLDYREDNADPRHQYRPGPTINPSYNRWVKELMDHIERSLIRPEAYCPHLHE